MAVDSSASPSRQCAAAAAPESAIGLPCAIIVGMMRRRGNPSRTGSGYGTFWCVLMLSAARPARAPTRPAAVRFVHASFSNAKTDFWAAQKDRANGSRSHVDANSNCWSFCHIYSCTGPLALAEEATPHHTVHNHHDNRHPYSRFRHHHRGPSPEFGTHHGATHPYSRFRHHHRGPSPDVGR